MYEQMSFDLEKAEFSTLRGLRLRATLPANERGADYIVGDLHGCLDQLEELLAKVGFNAYCDRLFSVGDMVDRGPDSLRCLGLLEQPWFFALMGNHEQMMLNHFLPWLLDDKQCPNPESDVGMGFILNGGAWILREPVGDYRPRPPLDRLLWRTLDLPMTMVVGEGEQRFNLVHAEFTRPGFSLKSPGVWTDDDIDRLPERAEPGVDVPSFRWSRSMMGVAVRAGNLPKRAEGLSITYCGHNIGSGVRVACSHICLDTGAFLAREPVNRGVRFGLSIADPKRSRYLTWRPKKIEERPL